MIDCAWCVEFTKRVKYAECVKFKNAQSPHFRYQFNCVLKRVRRMHRACKVCKMRKVRILVTNSIVCAKECVECVERRARKVCKMRKVRILITYSMRKRVRRVRKVSRGRKVNRVRRMNTVCRVRRACNS